MLVDELFGDWLFYFRRRGWVLAFWCLSFGRLLAFWLLFGRFFSDEDPFL
jgi:hypothetical protein